MHLVNHPPPPPAAPFPTSPTSKGMSVQDMTHLFMNAGVPGRPSSIYGLVSESDNYFPRSNAYRRYFAVNMWQQRQDKIDSGTAAAAAAADAAAAAVAALAPAAAPAPALPSAPTPTPLPSAAPTTTAAIAAVAAPAPAAQTATAAEAGPSTSAAIQRNPLLAAQVRQ